MKVLIPERSSQILPSPQVCPGLKIRDPAAQETTSQTAQLASKEK